MSRPLVLTLVGTDHHPFDRLVDWSDVVATELGDRVDVVVQHGHTRPPLVARGHDFLPHVELESLLRDAAMVICHGGPGTIADARRAGHVPLCVPRDPRLGEHVDHHQLTFARVVDDAGVVQRAESERDVVDAVRVGIGSTTPRSPGHSIGHAEACHRFADEVRDLMSSPARRREPSLRILRGLITPMAEARRGPSFTGAGQATPAPPNRAAVAHEQQRNEAR